MKGIVLAGGTGSRLWPATQVASKQLLPIYDKPMIYYPISTLMLAGVRDILVITTPEDQNVFRHLLGDGASFGVNINYQIQNNPEGLAQAYILAEDFLNNEVSMMILGDNIFHGVGLGNELSRSDLEVGARIHTYEVADPSQYGILTIDESGKPVSVQEKPTDSTSRLAITGLYIFDGKASQFARKVKPSARGELEITSLIEMYLEREELFVNHLSRGTAWLDTGTPAAMHDASSYIRVVEDRTGLKIGCIEEIAFRNGWITKADLTSIRKKYKNNSSGQYLDKFLSLK